MESQAAAHGPGQPARRARTGPTRKRTPAPAAPRAMNRAHQGIRGFALLVVALLLWCHGLDASFYAHAAAGPAPAAAADPAVATPAPTHADVPAVSCCFGGAGSNLLAAGISRVPALPAPVVAALLSALLLPAAAAVPRLAPRRHALHRTTLVARAVLIRI